MRHDSLDPQGSVSRERQDALRRLLPYFDSVEQVAPVSIRWSQLSFSRSSAPYRMLMGTCELVIRGLLPTEEPGANSLLSWVTDEAMSSLYERFLREYFDFTIPSYRLLRRRSDGISTARTRQGQTSCRRCIRTSRCGEAGRTVIIDAKYYSKAMQVSQYGKSSVRSAHIYQIHSYTKNADVGRDGSVSGMLLYASTDAGLQPDLDVTIQGNRIAARTLDLNLQWEQLRAQLEEITTWLD
jgi:5-methylcytosine-specific restriction enzyme subunit McrC